MSGKLVAAQTQKLFSPGDAIADEVLVQNGQAVRTGDVLVRLRSAKLDLLGEQVTGDLAIAETELSVAQASRSQVNRNANSRSGSTSASTQEVLKARIAGLKQQQQIIAKQRDALMIRSPIDGIVDRWNIDQSLRNRPVAHGEYLMDVIAPDGGWHVRLDIPESDCGYVIDAHQADSVACHLRLTSDTQVELDAALRDLDQATVIVQDGRSVLRATVDIVDGTSTQDFRVGATVIGSIDCGKRSLGFVWFRSLIQWWRQHAW